MSARLHKITRDSGRFPNRNGRVQELNLDADLIKTVVPGAEGNSTAILYFGGGVELCETPAEALFWIQEPKQLQGASAAVNLFDPSVAKIEFDTTGATSKANARGAAKAAAYFTKMTTTIASGFIALPSPAKYKVVKIQNAGTQTTTICTQVNTELLNGTADGDTTIAIASEKTFYCKENPALGWFEL